MGSSRPVKKRAKTGSAAPGSRAPEQKRTKLTIKRDSDGSMTAILAGTKRRREQKSQLSGGFIECGDGENAQMTIPFTSEVVGQWMRFRNYGEAGDVTICCNVLQVASYLQDDVTVAAITWEIVGAVRNEMLEGLSKYQNFLKDCKWGSKSFKKVTQPLQKVLGDSELMHVASRFHLQELMAAPSFLLQACLLSLLAQRSTLDLSQLSELFGQPGYAKGVKQVLTAAAAMPFTSLILPLHPPGPQPYISKAMPNVTSIQFWRHAVQCVTNSTFSMDEKLVCAVLELMPNVQAITLSAMTTSENTTAGAKKIAAALNSLTSLASLSFYPIPHLQPQSPGIFLIPARYILAHLSHTTALTSVCLPTEAARDSAGAAFHCNSVSGEIVVPSVHTLLSAFSNLQHLEIGTHAPCSKSDHDITGDLVSGLHGELSWVTALTALTHLDATYNMLSCYIVKRACSMRFLEAVGKLFLPLEQLSVLRLKLACAYDRNSKLMFSLDDVADADAGDTSRMLCSFDKLCARLHETHITSTGCDPAFPVAHMLRCVTSIRSLQLKGIAWLTGSEQPSVDAQAFSSLSCLSLLTDLQIDLKKDHGSACIEGLASALGTLQRLRKLCVVGSGDLLAPKQLGDSIASLSALEDLQCDDVPSSSFVENPDTDIVAFASTLTRLKIHENTSISSSFMKHLTKLKNLDLGSHKFSQSCFEDYAFLSSMHELEHLNVAVSVGRDDDVMQIHDLGHIIGGLRALTFLSIGFEFVDPDMCSFANHLSSLCNLQSLSVQLSHLTRCQDEDDHDELMWAHEVEPWCETDDEDGIDCPETRCAQQMNAYAEACRGFMEPLRPATLGLKVPIKELFWIDKGYKE